MAASARRRQRRIELLVMSAALCCALGQDAVFAQIITGPKADPKWTAEVHGGVMRGPAPTGGAAGQFPSGTTFATEPGFPSRANSSWYFGDGAALLNEVNAQFASRFNIRFPQVVPLDSVLTSAGVDRQGGSSWGFRIARRIRPRLGAEFSFDRSHERLRLTGAARNAIETTRTSFERAFSGLIGTIPQIGLRVTSTADIDEASAHRTAITGVLTIGLTKHGRIATHVLAGAGRVLNRADPLEARVRGNYQFRFFDTFPVNETDAVTIRFTERDAATVGVVGGGVTADVGERHGVRADVRVFAGGSGAGTFVDASPSVQRLAPFVALPSNTNPSLQFSTTTTERSSLNGSTAGLQTFTGSGLDIRIVLNVGYCVRF